MPVHFPFGSIVDLKHHSTSNIRHLLHRSMNEHEKNIVKLSSVLSIYGINGQKDGWEGGKNCFCICISDSKIIFIFYQILIKENLSQNLESVTIN